MRIRRSRPTVEWTQVPNVVARDYRISWRARGLLLELLSYPPGWETTIDDMVKHAQRRAKATGGGKVEGRDAMRAAARELKQAGYLVVTKRQDEQGRWHTDIEVTDAPMWDLLSSLPNTDDGFPGVGVTCGNIGESPGHTDDGFPGVGSPGVGSPGVKTKKETKKDPPPSELTEPSAQTPGGEEEVRPEAKSEGTESPGALVVDKAVAQWDRTHRRPSRSERLRLAERADQELTTGAHRIEVLYALTRDLEPSQVRTSAVQVVMGRTREPGWGKQESPPPAVPRQSRPEWCGRCNEGTRLVGLDRPRRCPDCHPLAIIATADQASTLTA